MPFIVGGVDFRDAGLFQLDFFAVSLTVHLWSARKETPAVPKVEYESILVISIQRGTESGVFRLASGVKPKSRQGRGAEVKQGRGAEVKAPPLQLLI